MLGQYLTGYGSVPFFNFKNTPVLLLCITVPIINTGISRIEKYLALAFFFWEAIIGVGEPNINRESFQVSCCSDSEQL
jgi:hypothetical protein